MSTSPTLSEHLILLHPEDNIASLTRSVEGTASLEINGQKVTVSKPLGLGHKIAIRDLAEGEKIIKWGAPIGSAKEAIALGDHVHLHNMKSDYLPTYTLEEGQKYGR